MRYAFACLILAVLGCDTPSRDADDAHLLPSDQVVVIAPRAADERVLTRGADDLFPALSGDDLVWVRYDVDPSFDLGEAEPPDCVTCTWCGGCRMRVMHRRLSVQGEDVVWSGRAVTAAPTVHDGLAAFADADGVTRLVDLAHQAQEQIPALGYLGQRVIVRDALVWWYGWDQPSQRSVIRAWDVTLPGVVASFEATVNQRWWSAGNGGGNIGRAQPFAVDDTRVVWSSAEDGSIVSARLADGETTTLVVDPGRVHLAPLIVGTTIVTVSYAAEEGCVETRCELALQKVQGQTMVPLAANAQPTIYLSPVSDGARVVWVDKREGAYMLMGVDVVAGGTERRLSSAEARIGALSAPAVDAGRIVWADHRSGRWQLMQRTW